MPLCQRKLAHLGSRRDARSASLENFYRFRSNSPCIDQLRRTAPGGLAAQEDVRRDIKRIDEFQFLMNDRNTAAGRITSDEPAGLYAMQTLLRRLRLLSIDDRGAQERLKALSNELREAVQDRFEQLELLPFRRP